MKKRTVLAGAVVAVALATLFVYLSTQDRLRSGADGSTRIAINIPLSGPVASFSGQWANGFQMGIEDGAAAAGIPLSRFAINVQDNQGQPPTAASIAQKQAASGFDVYVSGVSQMTRAVAPIVDQVAAVHFLVSYDAHLTERASNRMRILTHFKAEGPVYVEYARMRGAQRVFSFTLNNPEIQGQFTEYVEPGLEDSGASFVREVYEFTHSDFRTLALKAKAYAPDLILVSGFSVHILPIVRALRDEGMIEDGNVLCIMDFNELLLASSDWQEFEGVAYIAPPFEFPENQNSREEWSAVFQARFGTEPNFMPAFAYDTGRIVALAMERSGEVTKESVTELLPYQGVAGEISVDATGDLNTPLGILKVVAGGELERVR